MRYNILSLFDGCSGGQQALERTELKINKYIASEISKDPIRVTNYNYPDTIQIGDVRDIDVSKLPKIDILIGGSPCQSFSFSGKRNGMTTKDKVEILNLEDYLELKENNFEFEGQSYLFWEYMRILVELKKLNPKIIFLLENVLMSKKWKDVLTNAIGYEPIEINSSLVSAQVRKRLYWTNINDGKIEQPPELNIELNDILEDNKLSNKATITGRRLNAEGKRKDYDRSLPIIQCLEVRASNMNKSNCLTTVAKDNVLTSLPIGRHPDVYKKGLKYRHYTIVEYERLQTIMDNYTKYGKDEEGNIFEICISNRRHMIGNGWTIDVIVWILNHIERNRVV